MVEDKYERKAWLLRVVDGDTVDIQVDLGFQQYHTVRCRLYGVDTPEVYGVKKGSEEYLAGKEASAFTLEWLRENAEHVQYPTSPEDMGTYWEVTVRSYDGAPKFGYYNRWLVEIFPADGEGVSLNQALLEAGQADKA